MNFVQIKSFELIDQSNSVESNQNREVVKIAEVIFNSDCVVF